MYKYHGVILSSLAVEGDIKLFRKVLPIQVFTSNVATLILGSLISLNPITLLTEASALRFFSWRLMAIHYLK